MAGMEHSQIKEETAADSSNSIEMDDMSPKSSSEEDGDENTPDAPIADTPLDETTVPPVVKKAVVKQAIKQARKPSIKQIQVYFWMSEIVFCKSRIFGVKIKIWKI